MMTEQLRFSLLSAPLAAIDRRALSQAWYSALDLANPKQRGATGAPPMRSGDARVATPASPLAPVPTAPTTRPTSMPCAHAKRTSVALPPFGDERRAQRTPLARRIERVFCQPRLAVKRATFSLGAGAGRVVVTLQQRGARLHLVAVCPPNARPAVARALGQARFALAARGIALDVVDREVQCI